MAKKPKGRRAPKPEKSKLERELDEDGRYKIPVRRDGPEKFAAQLEPKYASWIVERVKGYEDAYGKCKKVAEEMVAAFPVELRLARGHYYDGRIGERGHWWCATVKDGLIVDPTAVQFPSLGHGPYVEFLGDDSELQTSVCMDCGDPVYGPTFCGPNCEAATRAYLNGI